MRDIYLYNLFFETVYFVTLFAFNFLYRPDWPRMQRLPVSASRVPEWTCVPLWPTVDSSLLQPWIYFSTLVLFWKCHVNGVRCCWFLMFISKAIILSDYFHLFLPENRVRRFSVRDSNLCSPTGRSPHTPYSLWRCQIGRKSAGALSSKWHSEVQFIFWHLDVYRDVVNVGPEAFHMMLCLLALASTTFKNGEVKERNVIWRNDSQL